MKYRALRTFCGAVNMATDEEKELDLSVAKPLLDAGYIEEVDKKKAKKKKDD